jgi:hypothetical protein
VAQAGAVGSMALARLRDVAGAGAGSLVAGSSQKSLVASGLLSFFFGPIGWLYAGHWKEALPAAGVLILLKFILPTFLLLPLLGVVGPVSAGVGVLYAWMYNRKGERQKLLPVLPEEKK